MSEKARALELLPCNRNCMLGEHAIGCPHIFRPAIAAALTEAEARGRAEALEEAAKIADGIAAEYEASARLSLNNGQMQDWERVAKRCSAAIRARKEPTP
jgi:hypothetical protein